MLLIRGLVLHKVAEIWKE